MITKYKLFETVKNITLYHSSDKLFDKFKINKIKVRGLKFGCGFYFSTNKNIAENFNKKYIYECSIIKTNLLNWNDLSKKQYNIFKNELKNIGITINKYDTTFSHIFSKMLNHFNNLHPNDKYTDQSLYDIYNFLIILNFDGIFCEDEYCIFKPDNIIINKNDKNNNIFN